MSGGRWDWSARWDDEDEEEAYAMELDRIAPWSRPRDDAWPPTGSLEESLREDAKWDRDDEPDLDDDER